MRINRKMTKYIEKNGNNRVKNYPEMCKILGENETSGEGKTAQLNRWRCYFDFEKKDDKHEFIIKKIYDDKTVKENEKAIKDTKDINQIFARSKYREDLVPILLYLLEFASNHEILESKLELAKICGFFNKDVVGKRRPEDYEKYRNEMKKEVPDKIYFKTEMDDFVYSTYLNQIKHDAYSAIIGVLTALQQLNILQYNIIHIGLKFENSSVEKYELLVHEEEIYKECARKACENILPLYNEDTKKKKEMIVFKDFMYRHKIREAYYDELNELVHEKLGYDRVMEYFSIILKDSNVRRFKQLKIIQSRGEFEECKKSINDKFVERLKNSVDYTIKKKKNYYIEARKISLATVEYFKNTKEGKDEAVEEKKYYNKSEIVDLLVSLESTTDIINLDEYEEKYYNSSGAFNYMDFEESHSDTVKAILEMFNIDE